MSTASPAPTLRPGDQLAGTVCTTRVVVVRAPADHRPALTCGGAPMVPAATAPPGPATGAAPVTLLGKQSDSTLNGKLNGGGPRVVLRSSGGDIRLRR